MLEKISMALETFASIYEGATKVFDDAKKDLHENYKGNLFADKMKEAKDLYEKTVDDSRSEQWNICVSILDQVRAKAKEVITKPIEGDFSATLDAVKAMKEPSRKELEALADRYKGNYFAYRAFVDALGDRLAGYYVITVDEVLEACDDLQMMLHRCFYDGEGVTGYYYRLMLQGDYIGKYDELFTSFMEGRFDKAGTIKKGMENPDESDGK